MNKQYEHYDDHRLNDLNIIEVARRLNIKLYRAGVDYKTNCLWHEDQHPSLILYNRAGNQHCHCYTCGAHHSVIDLVMTVGEWSFKEACQWLSNEFGIGTTTVSYIPQPKRRPEVKPEEPIYSYIPVEMVDRMVSTESSLCRCLMLMAHTKDALWKPEAVEWQIEEYRMGCHALWDFDDYTVFPSIDRLGRVCNLKVQHYDANPQSPRFGHDDKGQSYWLASMWVKQKLLPENTKYRCDCLFGEHLLSRYPDTTVALVESPKNAIFGALAFPEMIWLASGNKTNLKRSVLQPLCGRDVIVFPDCDAVDEWTTIIQGMTDLANFTVSDFCQRHAPEGQPKFDIADYLQAQFQFDDKKAL